MKNRLVLEVYAVPTSDRLIMVGYDQEGQVQYVDYQQGMEDDSYEALMDNFTQSVQYGEFYSDKFKEMKQSIKSGTLVEELDNFFWMMVWFEEMQSDLQELHDDQVVEVPSFKEKCTWGGRG